jgi:hypothetical protein
MKIRPFTATALKITSFHAVQQIGVQLIETGNEETNPMYQLDLSLGFTPQPAWLDFVRPM